MTKVHIVILLKAYSVVFLSISAPGVGFCLALLLFGLDGKVLIPTWHPDTLVLVSFVPCLQLAVPGAVEDLAAAATSGQLHGHRATAVIAELQHWLPEKRFTHIELKTGSRKIWFSLFCPQLCVQIVCVYTCIVVDFQSWGVARWHLPPCTQTSLCCWYLRTHMQTQTMIYRHTCKHKRIVTCLCFCFQKT